MSRDLRKKIIEERIKKVVSLEKELEKIQLAHSCLGNLMLDKPLRDGWFRTLIIKESILKSKNGKVYHEILEAVVKKVWGREKIDADKKWNVYFERSWRCYLPPGVRFLNEKEFQKLSSRAKKLFFARKRHSPRGYTKYYVCIIPKSFFVTSYQRAYIISRKIISPELERREQEIMEILSTNELSKYSKFYNQNFKWYYKPGKKLRIKSKTEVNRIINYDLK